jgi:hypothetical protein
MDSLYPNSFVIFDYGGRILSFTLGQSEPTTIMNKLKTNGMCIKSIGNKEIVVTERDNIYIIDI